jgi:hypothetical protein
MLADFALDVIAERQANTPCSGLLESKTWMVRSRQVFEE